MTHTKSNNKFLSFALIIISAFLLTAAFPKFNIYALAWVAFLPLFHVITNKSLSAAFGYSYLTGLIFFWLTVYWVGFVTWPGTALMIFYLALYFGIFGAGFVFFRRYNGILRVLGLAALWTALEYIRAHLLSGFGWASLAHSQYLNLPLVQWASLIGETGVSFLVMIFNLTAYEFVCALCYRKKSKRWMIAFFGSVIAVYVIGTALLFAQPVVKPSFRVGAVQANVPLEIRWNPAFRESIVSKHLALSEELIEQRPDLIVWPESSFPGVIWESPRLFDRVRAAARQWKTPMLIGVVTEVNNEYFNSAMMIDEDGDMLAKYDKHHLVPFGEYIPLRNIFPFLEQFVPIDDFTAGEVDTLFPIKGLELSTLICFEDTFGYLARQYTQNGAQVLINMTNDAWFNDTKAPYLHLASSVFRAVENRRSVVRVANTGVTAAISPFGHIDYLHHPKQTFVTAVDTFDVTTNSTITPYTKYGNIFTWTCFIGILFLSVKITFNPLMAERRDNIL